MHRLQRPVLLSICIALLLCTLAAKPDTAFSLSSFLAKPFDLQQFKEKKHSSNSSVNKRKSWYARPGSSGIYYSFFIFEKARGYIGETPGQIRMPAEGFTLITFKPPGKNQHMYTDPSETLIELTALYNDADLPELAFVGVDTLKVKNKIGEPVLRKPNWLIYTSNNNALLLQQVHGRVSFLRYIRLNFKLTADNIPADLLKTE